MRSWYKNGQPVENWRHFKQRCLLFRSETKTVFDYLSLRLVQRRNISIPGFSATLGRQGSRPTSFRLFRSIRVFLSSSEKKNLADHDEGELIEFLNQLFFYLWFYFYFIFFFFYNFVFGGVLLRESNDFLWLSMHSPFIFFFWFHSKRKTRRIVVSLSGFTKRHRSTSITLIYRCQRPSPFVLAPHSTPPPPNCRPQMGKKEKPKNEKNTE
jgi:hypothetical protein